MQGMVLPASQTSQIIYQQKARYFVHTELAEKEGSFNRNEQRETLSPAKTVSEQPVPPSRKRGGREGRHMELMWHRSTTLSNTLLGRCCSYGQEHSRHVRVANTANKGHYFAVAPHIARALRIVLYTVLKEMVERERESKDRNERGRCGCQNVLRVWTCAEGERLLAHIVDVNAPKCVHTRQGSFDSKRGSLTFCEHTQYVGITSYARRLSRLHPPHLFLASAYAPHEARSTICRNIASHVCLCQVCAGSMHGEALPPAKAGIVPRRVRCKGTPPVLHAPYSRVSKSQIVSNRHRQSTIRHARRPLWTSMAYPKRPPHQMRCWPCAREL